MKRHAFGLLGAAAILFLSGKPAMADELLVNGGFEAVEISPWTVGGDLGVKSVLSANAVGARFAEITFPTAFFSAASGSLSQSFTLASDGLFDYAFKVGRSEAIGPFNDGGMTFKAMIDGSLLSDLLPTFDPFSSNRPDFSHLTTDYSGQLALAAGAHVLSFTFSRPETGFGRAPFFVLDAASIVPSAAVPGVPEPASWALMIAGFGLAGTFIRQRRSSSPPQFA